MFSEKNKSGLVIDTIDIADLDTPEKKSQYLTKHPIAYFCAEYAIDDSIPIYAGGLGILAGDTILEAQEENIPFVAVGLFYRRGFASYPKISTKNQSPLDPAQSGFELVKNVRGDRILVSIPVGDREISCQAWVRTFGSAVLYLLDINIPENNEDDRKICTYLYPDSFENRMTHEIILGIGGVELLKLIHVNPSVYHLNEGHTGFAALALAVEYMKNNTDAPRLADAIEKVRPLVVGTKHTILPGAGIFFTKEQCKKNLFRYLSQHGVSVDELLSLGTENDDAEIFSTTRFLLRVSARANAVSKLHSLAEAKVPSPLHKELIPITNGINATRWMMPALGTSETSAESLWSIHTEAKRQLFEYIKAVNGIELNPESLAIVWARRIVEYKQPLLIFSDVERLRRILTDAKKPVAIIFAGNAYAGDSDAVKLLEETLMFIKSMNLPNILYLHDYSLSLCKKLSAGADVWLNTPQNGKEASGTSGMKAGVNGALQFSVEDGWVGEANLKDSMWSIEGSNIAEVIYSTLENKIIPEFFNREGYGMPDTWIAKMQKTRAVVLKDYSTRRMLADYMSKLYFPPRATAESDEAV
ncbi:MAG: alpha-glucan family phosphorylase [Candidatus Taylorbacteria bacterium]